MTKNDVLSAMGKLSLQDLQSISFEFSREVTRRSDRLIRSIKVEKQPNQINLSHERHGSFVCKKVAFAGRWRVWKLKDKKKVMVIEESMTYDIDDIRLRIALGQFDAVGDDFNAAN